MPHGSGRKSSFEWREVDEIENENSKVICKHCNTIISKKIERIRVHLKKCINMKATVNETEAVPDDSEIGESAVSLVGTTAESEEGQSFSELGNTILSREHSSSTSFCSSTPLKKRQKSISSYILQTSSEIKQDIDFQLAKFFFSSNIAFRNVENPHFMKMIEKLRPGYHPPNRKKLAGPLLDQVHTQVMEDIKADLSSTPGPLILMQDGWSNTQNDPIIAHSVHNGTKSTLCSITEPKDNKKTAEYCSTLAEKAMDKIKMDFGKEVFAVCTDNEHKMNRMKEILKEKNPNLITYGCSAHYMNLLEKDVSPKPILKHIVEVHKYFRNHHLPHSWLKEKGGKIPQIPNETRWNSQIACVETYVFNYKIYLEIRGEHADIPDNIGKIVDNVAIYRESQNLLSQLKLFGVALDKLQSDTAHLSDSVHIWTGLLKEEILEPYHEVIRKRFKDAMNEYHFLAYMTDPRYSGENLNVDEESVAEEFLSEHAEEFLSSLCLFKLRDPSIFPTYMFKKSFLQTVTPERWWRLLGQRQLKVTDKNNKLSSGFCEFIGNLQCCPASSGSIERVFSTFGLLWNKLRNSMGSERAEKLVTIYRHLNTDVTSSES